MIGVPKLGSGDVFFGSVDPLAILRGSRRPNEAVKVFTTFPSHEPHMFPKRETEFLQHGPYLGYSSRSIF